MSPNTDRNLLFGILALQLNFIDRDVLVAAMHAWVLDQQKSLGLILREQGKLTTEQLKALEALIVEHVKAHEDDPKKRLQALAKESSVESFLPVSDAEVASSFASFSTTPQADQHIDPPHLRNDRLRYRILRSHAKGGLGEVFVAEDTELHREVALKEIQGDRADEPASRLRFILEAEITGGLEHPGIVPVYGLGSYPDGRPYYAMRFIRGDSLKEAVEAFHSADQDDRDPGERSLAFRQLLRRFIDVCNAVAYAHSRGVLHRDIKPANIMLGKFGETLVVDWGLAKVGARADGRGTSKKEAEFAEAMLRPASGSDVLQTMAGSAVGTPAYMSPEQAEGRINELGPETDIYSLGTTLYVLLTGQKPFDGEQPAAVLSRVRQGKYVAPLLAKIGTPPALDAVCRKAMALRPSDRYHTPQTLAADLEHWLADEPVSAYEEPWLDRAARWCRRHRTLLLSAITLLLTSVVALAVCSLLVWREERRTAEQKQKAEENYQLARELSFNSIDLIENSEVDFASYPALHGTRKQILTAAAKAFRKYLEEEPNDVELQERCTLVFRFAANLHRLLNETEPAETLYADGTRLLEGLVEQAPESASRRERLSATLRDHAQLQVKQGKLRQAREKVQSALEIAEKLRTEAPDRPMNRRLIAIALLDRSGIQNGLGEFAESEKSAQQAVELFRGLLLLPPGEGHSYDPVLLAASLNRVAMAQRESGRIDVARATHAEAIKLLQDMVEKRTSRVNLADILNFLARCRVEQGRTWIVTPERRTLADKNLSGAAQQWEGLAKTYEIIFLIRAYNVRKGLQSPIEHDYRFYAW